MDYPFNEKPVTAVIVCSHILENNAPILYVTHDEEDGMWQFLCGDNHTEDEARIVALEEVWVMDSTIGKIAEMPKGYYATRMNISDEWIIQKM